MDPTPDDLFQFPCQFPIKVMGYSADDFAALVVRLIRNHVGELSQDAVSLRESTGGKYLSVTVTINATSREQLDRLYRELSAHERILMVL